MPRSSPLMRDGAASCREACKALPPRKLFTWVRCATLDELLADAQAIKSARGPTGDVGSWQQRLASSEDDDDGCDGCLICTLWTNL